MFFSSITISFRDPTSPIHPTTKSANTTSATPAERCAVVLDSLFDGLLQDLACVLLVLGEQVQYTPVVLSGGSSGAKKSSTGKTNNTTNTTTNTSTNNNTNYSSSNNTIHNATTTNNNTTNTTTLSSSVLNSSSILGTSLFESVAYFSNMAGITTTNSNTTNTTSTATPSTNNGYANNTGTSPVRNVVSGVEKLNIGNGCGAGGGGGSNGGSGSGSGSLCDKYTRRIQLLQQYKHQCMSSNSTCDVYSALVVCGEVSHFRETEVMQRVVVDLMHTMNKNFGADR